MVVDGLLVDEWATLDEMTNLLGPAKKPNAKITIATCICLKLNNPVLQSMNTL